MGAVELQDVGIVHEGRTILEHVDLRVDAGEVVALVGPSGSGKTSLLRVIAGFEPVAEGRVLLAGRDVAATPTHERDLGMVAQGAPLHPGLDVEGNLRLPLDLRGDERVAATERVRGEALRFNLARLLRRRPDQLSVGEQATAATARSVIRAPGVLLLDEPAANLDARARAALLQQLGIAQRTRGTTIVLATNDVRVAAALAQRVAVLDRGTVAQVDTLAGLRDGPVTLDVADLVAPVPLGRLRGQVIAGAAGQRAHLRTAAGDLRTWHPVVGATEGDVVVAVGPRDLRLTRPSVGPLRGQVRRVATTGARRLVTVATSAGDVTVDVPGTDAPPQRDSEVGLAPTRALVATPEGDVVASLTWPTPAD